MEQGQEGGSVCVWNRARRVVVCVCIVTSGVIVPTVSNAVVSHLVVSAIAHTKFCLV